MRGEPQKEIRPSGFRHPNAGFVVGGNAQRPEPAKARETLLRRVGDKTVGNAEASAAFSGLGKRVSRALAQTPD